MLLFVPTRVASMCFKIHSPMSSCRAAWAQSFIQAATRPPPKRAAKRKPVEPIGKYETTYQSRHTNCAMAAMKVRIVLCNYSHADIVSEHELSIRVAWGHAGPGCQRAMPARTRVGGRRLTPREK